MEKGKITLFPFELLDIITSQLTSPIDLLKYSLICKRFHKHSENVWLVRHAASTEESFSICKENALMEYAKKQVKNNGTSLRLAREEATLSAIDNEIWTIKDRLGKLESARYDQVSKIDHSRLLNKIKYLGLLDNDRQETFVPHLFRILPEHKGDLRDLLKEKKLFRPGTVIVDDGDYYYVDRKYKILPMTRERPRIFPKPRKRWLHENFVLMMKDEGLATDDIKLIYDLPRDILSSP